MKKILKRGLRDGFTLTELLIVIGVIAVLAIVVVYTLNPHGLVNEGQDGNRVSAMNTLDKAVSLYYSNAMANPSTLSMGTSGITYVSIPDPTATTTAGTNCAGIGLTSTSTTYHCAASSTYEKVDGTGWIPINFTSYPGGSPIASLPVDPVNTTSSSEYYTYVTNGTQYAIMAVPGFTGDASDTNDFVKGSNLALLSTSTQQQGGGGPQKQIVFVSDTTNNQIEEFSATGSYMGLLSSYGSGNGNGQLNSPAGIAIDASGNIWVTNSGNGRVEEFSSSGIYESQFTGTVLVNAQGITIDASGNIWVVNPSTSHVYEFSPNGNAIGGVTDTGSNQLSYPEGIAIDASGNIWVADTDNNRIEEFSSSGIYESQFTGTGSNQLSSPTGITIDASGNIWVADSNNSRVEEFSSSGTYKGVIGSYGKSNGQFGWVSGIAIDTSGNFWISDYTNPNYGGIGSRIQEFSASGTYESQLATSTFGGGEVNFITVH